MTWHPLRVIITGKGGYTQAFEDDPRVLVAGGQSVTECQGCGAWNDTRRTVCVLCGTPLAATDEWDAATELPPLPPLPDGGLRASMPFWLREPTAAPTPDRAPILVPAPETPALGPTADPRTFLTDDDFPRWLRDLAARHPATPRRGIARGGSPALDPAGDAPEPDGWVHWPRPAALLPAAAAPDPIPEASVVATPTPTPAPTPAGDAASPPDGRPPVSVVAARAREEHRGREPWESLLLVLLVLGVLVAALWALVVNGVFSPGL